MRKIILFIVGCLVLLPSVVFAYTVTPSARSYSVPIRTYSAPIRSYSAPKVYSSPSRTYSAPKTYSAPTRTFNQPAASQPIKVNNYSSSPRSYSYNPFTSNFILWYLIFGNHSNNINSYATSTKN